MSKYDKMLEINHKQSMEKIQRAKLAIQEMICLLYTSFPALLLVLHFWTFLREKFSTVFEVVLEGLLVLMNSYFGMKWDIRYGSAA